MKSLEELKAIRERMQNQVNLRESGTGATRVVVGMATCGIASGARPVLTTLSNLVQEKGLTGKVIVTQTGCIGLCRIPHGFAGVLPFLHGRCRKSSGCVRNCPTDREPCSHSIRNSIRCNPVHPAPDNSDSSLVSMSERRGSP